MNQKNHSAAQMCKVKESNQIQNISYFYELKHFVSTTLACKPPKKKTTNCSCLMMLWFDGFSDVMVDDISCHCVFQFQKVMEYLI